MFIFKETYLDSELNLEDDDLREEESSFRIDWSSIKSTEPLGKEGLRKKIMEILGEQE